MKPAAVNLHTPKVYLDVIGRGAGGTDKLTGLRRPLTISDAGKADSKEDGDALEDHDRGHG